jgi:hypothetical protein
MSRKMAMSLVLPSPAAVGGSIQEFPWVSPVSEKVHFWVASAVTAPSVRPQASTGQQRMIGA